MHKRQVYSKMIHIQMQTEYSEIYPAWKQICEDQDDRATQISTRKLFILENKEKDITFLSMISIKVFSLGLQRMTNRQLKNWAGISRTFKNGLLICCKKNFRWGLLEISAHYQRIQLIKYELLCSSKDSTNQKLYKRREAMSSKLAWVWKASKLSSIVNAEVELNLKFPVQYGNRGKE